jgi:hypothetical protein
MRASVVGMGRFCFKTTKTPSGIATLGFVDFSKIIKVNNEDR